MQDLGLDVHAANFTLAHMNGRGKLCQMYERTTSAEHLIDVMDVIRGPKRLVVEESHLAQWVKHVLEAHVDELIVCDPKRNRWIADDDYADDKSSARTLAKLLHGGFIKPIRHPDDVGAEMRALFLHYYNLTRQGTRYKNMLKATFRQVAVSTPGAEVYETKDRKQWLSKLKEFPALQQRAGHYFNLLQTVAVMKDQAYSKMVKSARKSEAFNLLQTVPGIGPVIATGYIALIDTPHRFSKKNKLWAYACLGNKYHKSDEAVYENRRSKTGCRPLKWLVMQRQTPY
jgi:transposase